MSLTKMYRGKPGDECQCGRRKSIRHCPALRCGSFKIYAPRPEIIGDKAVQRFKCIRCGHRFTDAETEFCLAPFVETNSHAAQRQLKIMNAAIADGHPLTDKETLIKRGVDSILKNNPELDGAEITLTADEDRAARLDWANRKIEGRYHTETKEEWLDKTLADKRRMYEAAKQPQRVLKNENDIYLSSYFEEETGTVEEETNATNKPPKAES